MSVTGKVNGRTVQFNEKDGRYYYTFTSDSDSFEINHLGCDGHSEIENIQVEYGNEMTKFSDPYTTSNPFSGLLRDLTHIRLQMTDPNSEFRSQLLLTNKGLLTEFENGKMKQALALTSQQFTNQISSLEETDREIRRQLTEVVRTAEGIKSSVKSEYIDSITRKITQLESDQIQTSREVSTKLTSSEVRELVGGMGYVTTQTFNHTRDLADVHSRILGRTEAGAPTKLAEMVMSAEVFRREITRIENTASENTRSSLTQLSNSIDLGIFGSSGALSRIVLNPSGVKIKGNLIDLDGTVNMNDAFIKKLMVDTASIQTLTAFAARINDLKVITIDAGKIVSGTMSANRIRGGNLSANNGAINFDLNNGLLDFKTNSPAIRRTVPNFPNQMVKFETVKAQANMDLNYWGDSASTIIGSNRYMDDYAVDDNFSGVRILNAVSGSDPTKYIDRIDLIGDLIYMTHTGALARPQSRFVFLTNQTGGTNIFYPENTHGTSHDIGTRTNPFRNLVTKNVLLSSPLNPNQDLVEILMNIHWHLTMLHDRTGGSASKSQLFRRLK